MLIIICVLETDLYACTRYESGGIEEAKNGLRISRQQQDLGFIKYWGRCWRYAIDGCHSISCDNQVKCRKIIILQVNSYMNYINGIYTLLTKMPNSIEMSP